MEDCLKIGKENRYSQRKEYSNFRKGDAYLKQSDIVAKSTEFYTYYKAKDKVDNTFSDFKSQLIVFRTGKVLNNPNRISFEKRLQFKELASIWEKEAAGQSSMSQALTPTYLKILTLGTEIIPLILKELEKKPNFWFIALRAFSDENPVPKQHMGNVLKMRDAWLSWGRRNNHI